MSSSSSGRSSPWSRNRRRRQRRGVAILLLVIISRASGAPPPLSRPKLSIQIRDGTFANLEGLDPSIRWSTTASAAGCDLEVGVDVAVRPRVASPPCVFWGRASRDVKGWGFSARADMEFTDSNAIALDVRAAHPEWDVAAKVLASIGTHPEGIRRIELRKVMNVPGGKLSMSPSYDLPSSAADVLLGYGVGDTVVTVAASARDQKLTVSRQITDTDRIAPSVTNSGQFAVQWEKRLSDGGNTVTTTIIPKHSINILWEDGPWTTYIDAPLDGMKWNGINVRVKRTVTME